MNHNFDFQGCQKMHIRVAISQKGLIGLFANCCHLMLLGPKEWKHKSKVLRTHFKDFFIPGTLCLALVLSLLWHFRHFAGMAPLSPLYGRTQIATRRQVEERRKQFKAKVFGVGLQT